MQIYTQALDWVSPREVLANLKNERGVVLLESVRGGRYSILVSNPVALTQTWQGFQKLLKKVPKIKSSLPFCGGLVGMLSYELVQEFEKIAPRFPEKFPRVWVGLYDSGLVFDHEKRSVVRFGWDEKSMTNDQLPMTNDPTPRPSILPLRRSHSGQVRSNFSKQQYLTAIREIKKYLQNGRTYQVNLSQRFSVKVGEADSISIYKKLAETNPAPFAGYLDAGSFQILSSSPELLFRIQGGEITTWPIAGTRPRGKNSTEDRKLMRELKSSPKENAEHAMLVDLERNDLGRVCEHGSVKVSDFARVEKYARVQHLVSTVSGKLRKDVMLSEIIQALFPGGTITGCPKIETMKIIAELEQSARGPYTGSLGYVSANGNTEFNILIRTLVLQNGVLSWQAGGGIVADSRPEAEYEETLHKAAALLEAVLNQLPMTNDQ